MPTAAANLHEPALNHNHATDSIHTAVGLPGLHWIGPAEGPP